MGVIKSLLVLFCPILFVGLSYAICYFSTNFALAKCPLFHSSPGDMSDASLDYLKHYNMKIFQFLLVVSLLPSTSVMAQEVQFTPLADNAVRVKYGQPRESRLPDWIYINKESQATSPKAIHYSTDKEGNVIIRDAKGKVVFKSVGMSLSPSSVQGEPTQIAELSFVSPKKGKEYQYGLGQFQDGVSDVFGLTRRLTQVNTQISVPMLMSSNGYAILWNNYGLTEFNPCSHSVKLSQVQDDGNGKDEVVDVTTTSGNRREVRHSNAFSAEIDIDRTADYTFLLDVGQKMARKHWMSIDGDVVVDMNNVWLPPTTSTTLHLTKGRHTILVQGTRGDQPVVYWEEIDQTTTFRSPVAECVDFTVFTGRPDEIVATYRKLTGQAPAMPEWALGYIHCRERFHSQDEILATARRFQKENIPLDVIVQDWQWWGKYGWNAMQFDEDHYPQPKEMMDTLHSMNVRLMLSVWSKIDRNSALGKETANKDYYIHGTDWIDFFNPEAAGFYWENFNQRLVPTGIDCWWQDATEPENDDLVGRKVWNNTLPGEMVRNVYPLLVCKTVYEGSRDFILTRSGFPGIQRYGAAMWSGDVGNDWETLRRQIVGGLGLMATGIPWWTYDAGGFFRPNNQYTDKDYQERLIRWIQTSVFLPLMRVHGYMSNTEPWNYLPETQRIFVDQIRLRHKLLPYIIKEAELVAKEGSTLMRPLIFDFPNDEKALQQETEFMFGHELLVCPVYQSLNEGQVSVYLPINKAGWTDYFTGEKYKGGQTIQMLPTIEHIPVFKKN